MIGFLGVLCLLLPQPNHEESLTRYFLDNRTEHSLILDRSSDRETVSVAATGFGMPAWWIAADQGLITKKEAMAWTHQCLDHIQAVNPEKNRGWLYHFIDDAGNPRLDSEVSTIDTALFYAGAQLAAEMSGDADLQEKVDIMLAKIDQQWLLRDGYFVHGLYWDGDTPRFIEHRWDDHSEGVILYKLFDKPFEIVDPRYDYPLFVYYYPLCFYPDAESVEHLRKAVDWQIEQYGVCGVTACDGPFGYCVNDPRVISPMSVWAAAQYSKRAQECLEDMPWAPTTGSYYLDSEWVSTDLIGVDCGSCLLTLR